MINDVKKTFGTALCGVDAQLVSVEVAMIRGTKMAIVGLPDNAIKESLFRIESALKHLGYAMPRQRVIVNLAPAGLRKEGSVYDLPIALGILAASDQARLRDMEPYMIMGELGLDGTIRPIRGALSSAIEAKRQGLRAFLLPRENAEEAAVVKGIDIIPASHITEAIRLLNGTQPMIPQKWRTTMGEEQSTNAEELDLADVQGQSIGKRALEIAAAGGHNLLFVGPPGAGKTMLARRMPSLLPPLNLAESLEVTQIYSVAGKLPLHTSLITTRPFRAPHHTISGVALVGGGSVPQPGEISFAHHGILFLDEFPEYPRAVLEVLRPPLEERVITINRAKNSVSFPANCILVASMNPCPCGYYTHPAKACICSPMLRRRYMDRLSGPLLDRIDLHVEVAPVDFDTLTTQQPALSSQTVRQRVYQARAIQQQRFAQQPGILTNATMRPAQVREHCQLDAQSKALLKQAMEKLSLSARAYDRILKVARTIADLAHSAEIMPPHIMEAIRYRALDRDKWGQG